MNPTPLWHAEFHKHTKSLYFSEFSEHWRAFEDATPISCHSSRDLRVFCVLVVTLSQTRSRQWVAVGQRPLPLPSRGPRLAVLEPPRLAVSFAIVLLFCLSVVAVVAHQATTFAPPRVPHESNNQVVSSFEEQQQTTTVSVASKRGTQTVASATKCSNCDLGCVVHRLHPGWV